MKSGGASAPWSDICDPLDVEMSIADVGKRGLALHMAALIALGGCRSVRCSSVGSTEYHIPLTEKLAMVEIAKDWVHGIDGYSMVVVCIEWWIMSALVHEMWVASEVSGETMVLFEARSVEGGGHMLADAMILVAAAYCYVVANRSETETCLKCKICTLRNRTLMESCVILDWSGLLRWDMLLWFLLMLRLFVKVACRCRLLL